MIYAKLTFNDLSILITFFAFLAYYYSWSFILGFFNKIGLPSKVVSFSATFNAFPNIGLQQAFLFLIMAILGICAKQNIHFDTVKIVIYIYKINNTLAVSCANYLRNHEQQIFILVNFVIFIIAYFENTKKSLNLIFGFSCFIYPLYIGIILARIFSHPNISLIGYLIIVTICTVVFGYNFRYVNGYENAVSLINLKNVTFNKKQDSNVGKAQNTTTNSSSFKLNVGKAQNTTTNSVNSIYKKSDIPIIDFTSKEKICLIDNHVILEKNYYYISTIKTIYYLVYSDANNYYILCVYNNGDENSFITLSIKHDLICEIKYLSDVFSI